MTDNEIIKALECCSKKDCKQCPAFDENIECGENTIIFALNLINRKDAEIKELETITGLMKNREYYNKFIKEVFQKETGNELLFPDFDEIYKRYFEQRAEIERLQKAIKVQDIMIGNQDLKIKGAKNEAIKEFAERLKEKATSTFYEEHKYVDTEDIDNLVKEMVGDSK
jgi:histone H3/H4